MAAKKGKSKKKSDEFSYCSIPEVSEREFGANVNPMRAFLIRQNEKKWVNGTILHYYFFDKESDGETVYFSDGTSQWVPYTTTEEEMTVVRRAFDAWKDVGIGIEFKEVDTRDEAEVRIGFMRGDGAWSYVGRDLLNTGRDERTMNFGWDLTRQAQEIDTAVHEIGHTLGFPHEHQNPNAGIVWDEDAVYASLAAPPNNWGRDKTYHNIIRKISPDQVQGSNWDPHSIMHYPFGPGLIIEPAEFRNGLYPEPGLSERDKTWVSKFYPPLSDSDYAKLQPFKPVELDIAAGEQKNLIIQPNATRKYNINTFGYSDTVMVLFEEVDGDLRYRKADDDSGEDFNAHIQAKLYKGRKYVLRIRLFYKDRAGETAVMLW